MKKGFTSCSTLSFCELSKYHSRSAPVVLLSEGEYQGVRCTGGKRCRNETLLLQSKSPSCRAPYACCTFSMLLDPNQQSIYLRLPDFLRSVLHWGRALSFLQDACQAGVTELVSAEPQDIIPLFTGVSP